ncbi:MULTISPECIES: type II toxin-antitoxin system RelE/ParE family toxin [unclassified Rhizobacter]|uniref:type II toxin-antitoxin system RelE/ParE family toxin n=1 Tax=unclassified Rhizobacter TaxID=2640088 RepID=UPI0006FDDB44|nr:MULTISPECIES: type II toxin-antitoxin system RelE/ParE family toxin [unclassified Rhizobacter]KQU81528.1 hypothetical protein ASC88_01230 [Rhizobacter sp. Root29]KQW12141.1 hypothetical protein ASC98_20340 [Rhizobacter sp. Root1238]KRB02956.1 hypothetical protein ASE08_15425 [Rhizobacter sp. Root16D2]
MRRLILTSKALADIREARRWYERQRKGLGEAFEQSVDDVLQSIRQRPQSYAETAPSFRRALVPRYPYRILFSVDQDTIVVVLLVHTARDPEVALSRLRSH